MCNRFLFFVKFKVVLKMSYESAGGSLKLKGVMDNSIKKKKKKKSKSSKSDILKEGIKVNKPDLGGANSDSDSSEKARSSAAAKTKAELAFERFNEKRNEEKVLKRAEKSHKERVELYNKHLDSLSEYNDIPKVSWTK